MHRIESQYFHFINITSTWGRYQTVWQPVLPSYPGLQEKTNLRDTVGGGNDFTCDPHGTQMELLSHKCQRQEHICTCQKGVLFNRGKGKKYITVLLKLHWKPLPWAWAINTHTHACTHRAWGGMCMCVCVCVCVCVGGGVCKRTESNGIAGRSQEAATLAGQTRRKGHRPPHYAPIHHLLSSPHEKTCCRPSHQLRGSHVAFGLILI